jgi:hypothetical protein
LATDNDTGRGASPVGGKDKKGILRQAREDWDRALARERENIMLAYADLEFLSIPGAQWPRNVRAQRDAEGRPSLEINRLPQFIHQITGDMRQMKPALKFVPVDDEADEKVADLFGGLSRYIENRSFASAVYARAADSQVSCGIAHWRVETEYADDSTFEQEIRISPIEDGIAVLWDPDANLPTKEDAQFCFVPVDYSRKYFEKRWPGVNPSSFDDEKWGQNSHWLTDDHVRVAEYWYKKPAKRKLALMPEGAIIDLDSEDDPEQAEALAQKFGARIEVRDSYKLCCYWITASDVLETVEWPGRLIPIVPLVGEETRIGRKIIRNGVVRRAMDPQRMYNYWHSAHTEVVALQPKAPFMVTEFNVAKYQELWEQANTRNLPYLVYEPDAKNGGQMPMRVQPAVSSQGVTEGLQLAAEDLKAVTGIYDASLGAKSNETSGKAILARQREGDVGSFVYIDNFSHAIRRTGQIIVDLIPHIYDTERMIRVMGEDGKIDIVEINKAQGIGPNAGLVNDVTRGSYDVVAQMGPSYSTRREEARDGMLQLLQAVPDIAPLILDKVAKAQDWPMADEIAARLRANLPPQILAMEEAEKQGMDPDQALQAIRQQQQPPPDPRLLKVQVDAQRAQAEQEHKQNQLIADMQKLVMQLRTQIEIAQINAGVGVHKTIVDATNTQYQADLQAHQSVHDNFTKAAIAAHQTQADQAMQAQALEAQPPQNQPEPQPGQ